jgi:hypothetical protein
MSRDRDPGEFFGLNHLQGGEMDPAGMVQEKKPGKNNPNISREANQAQKNNATNRSRQTRKQNGHK